MRLLGLRIMVRVIGVIAALLSVLLVARAEAAVIVHIDRGSQRMSVNVDGVPRFNWRVSTARAGYVTPPGVYHPQNAGPALVLQEILQFDDAAFDFLLWRLRYSRYLRDRAAWRSRFAWLRAARSAKRGDIVRPRRARRHGPDDHRHPLNATFSLIATGRPPFR
jgi:hypothetical protein